MKMAAFTVAALDRFPKWNECYPGGNAMNQAVHFTALGWNAYFIGALGNDEPGGALSGVLQRSGVDCGFAHIVEGETANNRIHVDEFGERTGIDGAWQGGVYETHRLKESDWARLAASDLWATHANHGDYLETLRRKTKSKFLAVDFLHYRDFKFLETTLPKVDIAYFGGTKDMEEPLARIAKKHNALIVLTLGKDGSVAFQSDRTFRQAALPLDVVVDTTGCGDAFQAGFTDSFYRFREVDKALESGAFLGRKTASQRGALAWPKGMEHLATSLY
jgi:fructoselysine 6-kinase